MTTFAPNVMSRGCSRTRSILVDLQEHLTGGEMKENAAPVPSGIHPQRPCLTLDAISRESVAFCASSSTPRGPSSLWG